MTPTQEQTKNPKDFVEGRDWILTAGLVAGIDTWNEREQRYVHLKQLHSEMVGRSEAFHTRDLQAGLPTVSLIIPAHNSVREVFEEALLSALAQSYPHVEVVVVDDGSTSQEHCALALEYAAEHQSIVFVKRDQTGGISSARNHGVSRSTGSYVGFLDHDDVLHPFAVELNVMLMIERSTTFQYSYECLLKPDGVSFTQFLCKSRFSLFNLLHYNYICHFATVSKELLSQIEEKDSYIFDSAKDGAEDHDLYLRLSELSAFRAGVTPAFLYYWRMGPTSTAGGQSQKSSSFGAAESAAKRSMSQLLNVSSERVEVTSAGQLSEARAHPMICLRPEPRAEPIVMDVVSFGPHESVWTSPDAQPSTSGVTFRSCTHFGPLLPDEVPARLLAQYLEASDRAPFVFLHFGTLQPRFEWSVWAMASMLQKMSDVASVGASVVDGSIYPEPLSAFDPGYIRANSSYQRSSRYSLGGTPRLETFRTKGTFSFESHETVANNPLCVCFRLSDYRSHDGFDWRTFPRWHGWLDLSLRQRQRGRTHVNLGVGLFTGHSLPRFDTGDQHAEDILLLKRHLPAIADMRGHTSYDFLHNASVAASLESRG
jgi:hypothetical protein